jgi:hypothetical protein
METTGFYFESFRVTHGTVSTSEGKILYQSGGSRGGVSATAIIVGLRFRVIGVWVLCKKVVSWWLTWLRGFCYVLEHFSGLVRVRVKRVGAAAVRVSSDVNPGLRAEGFTRDAVMV